MTSRLLTTTPKAHPRQQANIIHQKAKLSAPQTRPTVFAQTQGLAKSVAKIERRLKRAIAKGDSDAVVKLTDLLASQRAKGYDIVLAKAKRDKAKANAKAKAIRKANRERTEALYQARLKGEKARFEVEGKYL